MDRNNQQTVLPGNPKYFEGAEYDDDLIFNSTYNVNDVMDGMCIRNILLEKRDVIQTNTQTHKDDEGYFIGVLPDNTLYVSWAMYFRKKLFVHEDDVVCIKKIDKQQKVIQIWNRRSSTEDFVLLKDMN